MTNPADDTKCYISVGFATRFLPENGQSPAFMHVLDVKGWGLAGFVNGLYFYRGGTGIVLNV